MSATFGLDKFGIEKKFPDLEGGLVAVQDTNGWKETYEKHGYKSIKGVKIMRKTFSFNFDSKPKSDIEATIYVFLPGLNPAYGKFNGIGRCSSGSGLSRKYRGSYHSGDEDPNSAKCYIFHSEYEGGSCNNFQKEYPHPNYAKNTLKESNESPKWIGKLVGFKDALINTPDGTGVEFWSWFDESATLKDGKLVTENAWKLRYHDIDTGQFGKNGDNPSETTDPPFLQTFGKYIEFRMDNAVEGTKAFCASVREIRRA